MLYGLLFPPEDEETDTEQQVLGNIDNRQDLDNDGEEAMDDDEILETKKDSQSCDSTNEA